MPLTFTVLRCPDSIAPETRTVQGGEFTVGRGPGVDWVLPDPERLLSKHHFAVAYRGGSWQIADTSTNGTTLNRDPAPIGQSELRVLRDGDRLTVGSYEIEVRLTEDAVARERPDASIGGTEAGFGGPRRVPAVSPFADPFALDPLAPPPPARPAFDEPARQGFGLPTTAQLPSDFDPLAPEPGDQPFLGPTGSDHSPILQDAFRPPPTTGQMPLHTGGKLPGDDLLPDDWDKDLLEGINPQPVPPAPHSPPPPPVQRTAPPVAPPPVQPAARPFPDRDDQDPFAEPAPAARHAPVPFDEPFASQPMPSAPTPAEPITPAPAARAAAPPFPPLPPTAAPDAILLFAFLEGAGLADAQPADPAATMRMLGQAFRALVSGLREVLIARASIKSEFRIEQTMIRARGNNPLKFSAGDDDALAALLGTGRRTDMTAEAAVTDALKDIRLHELASLAAMQSAVRTVLDGLDPAKLRAQADHGGAMSVLPAQRKARAWDAFEALHARTVQALSDDFDSVFGKAFARAYERALDDVAAREK